MTLHATPAWEEAASAIAKAYPEDYADVAAWIAITDELGVEEEQRFALVNGSFNVYLFETKRLCVLGIGQHGDPDATLTHIFVKDDPDAVDGADDRARESAQALGIGVKSIFRNFM